MREIHTVVEVFDSFNLRNNVMASIVFGARRTIFLYEREQKDQMEGVCAFLRSKLPGLDIDKVLLENAIHRQMIEHFFSKLQKESRAGETIFVDINGGNPITGNYLRECCRTHNMPCIALDEENEQVIPIEHAEGFSGKVQVPRLKFSEILLLQGCTYNRNMHMLAEDKYFSHILDMSEYAFHHKADFNYFYNFVHEKSDGALSEPGNFISLKKNRQVSDRIINIFRLFEKHGFIHDFRVSASEISFTCVDGFVKEMLAVKGSWLELYIYILAKESGLFTEVYQSVMIGWDLKKRPQFNVENEIDVVLMKKGRPIFISCKMTSPKPEDMHEIYALADSFGGYGAVAALATSSDVRKRSKTLWNRAKEMDVVLIDFADLSREGLKKVFERL